MAPRDREKVDKQSERIVRVSAVIMVREMHGQVATDIGLAEYRASIYVWLIRDVASQTESEQELAGVCRISARLEGIELSRR